MTTLLFPGQGSQAKGMGADLFAAFPQYVEKADRILGRSIVALCRDDQNGDLRRTQFTQSALYVVGALSWLRWREQAGRDPDHLAGHSLGELTALFAGGAFAFETGLALVAKRGALMAALGEGGMTAVIGLDEAAVARVLRDAGSSSLGIANVNTPSQIVLAGAPADLKAAEPAFMAAGARACIPLNVSGAFHSRAMKGAQAEFALFLETVEIKDPTIAVVANVTAQPHAPGAVRANLAAQLCSPVRWSDSIRWIWGKGEQTFVEMAPGSVLSGLVAKIRAESTPLVVQPPAAVAQPVPALLTLPPVRPPPAPPAPQAPATVPSSLALGSASFRTRFAIDQAFVIGGLGHGIGSPALVERLARSGFLAFLGADGLPDDAVTGMVQELRGRLAGQTFGVNVRGRPGDEAALDARLRLLLGLKVNCIEVGGFHEVTRPLVRYRLTGLTRRADGSPLVASRLLAKVSRPETAQAFLAPPPPALVEELRAAGEISDETVVLASQITMADAVTALGDCGHDTDGSALWALLPVVLRLRDRLAPSLAIGAGGGIGTPDAAAAAFLMGADYVHLGSIMQCTVEAATSDLAKDMLARMGVQDSDLAPSEDWFDWGGKVRVLKRGSLFAARASKLYDLYRFHESFEAIPAAERRRIEERCLHGRFEDVAAVIRNQRPSISPRELMALVFRRYLAQARDLAIRGVAARSADFQICTGPAMGAFNAWAPEVGLADWRRRHADLVATTLADETAQCLARSVSRYVEDPPRQAGAGRSRAAIAP